MAPLWSTFTLLTEIIITGLILFIFYSGYTKNKFPYKVTVVAITYELLVNITYMVSKTIFHIQNETTIIDTPFQTGLAIFHGTLSLIMFIGLIVFLVVAWKNYRKKRNYFKIHKKLTITFIVFWLLSVLSGILFYFVIY